MRTSVANFRIFGPTVRPLAITASPVKSVEVKSASPEVAQPAKKAVFGVGQA